MMTRMKKIWRFGFFLVVFLVALSFNPVDCSATSATITATVNSDGSVRIKMDSSFPECPPDSYGGYTPIRHELKGPTGVTVCSSPGWRSTASATCTYYTDRSYWHGSHVFTAIAQGCSTSNEAISTYTLTLDNTPTIIITEPADMVTPTFNISVSANFQPTTVGRPGGLDFFLDNGYLGNFTCTTTICTRSLAVTRSVGQYTVKIIATGMGGTRSTAEKTFIVCNDRNNPCCPWTPCCDNPNLCCNNPCCGDACCESGGSPYGGPSGTAGL